MSKEATKVFLIEVLEHLSSKMAIRTEFSGNKFRLIDKKRTCAQGFVDEEIVDRIDGLPDIMAKSNAFIQRFSSIPPILKRETIRHELGGDLANYLFISSLVDYGNIGTSETLSLHLRALYRKYPFLFRPDDDFWDKLGSMEPTNSHRILSSILMPLSGLFRTDFENVVVKNWRNMIFFLREKCESDASNFFNYFTRCLLLDRDDPNTLEKFRCMLISPRDRKTLKNTLGMDFSIGPKTGSLLLSMITENLRGYNVLRGVNRAQVKRLMAPIDSAVIRVLLNTGLIKIVSVSPERENGRFARSDVTEVCQFAMELLSEKVGLLPIELDMHIWTIGTMPCKHRGKFCYICPITDICDSWKYGFVKESSGAEYTTRCFSFARPQTSRNALYLRGCNNCNLKVSCQEIEGSRIYHPSHNLSYVSRRYSETEEKLSLEDISSLLSSN